MMKKLDLKDIRRVIARNRGAASELARDLDVSPVTVYKVLNGLTVSERVMIAAEERAMLLLDENEIHA
jgi:DNA-binding IclR family transcriptional regulator